MKIKTSAMIASAVISIATASIAEELDVKILNTRGVSELKAFDILVNRPNEPKAIYKVIAIGREPGSL